MCEKSIAIVCLTVACIGILYYLNIEHFGSKTEKAGAIFQWFTDTKNKSYLDYRASMGGKSNIVEYEMARKMYEQPNFTAGAIEGKLM